MLTPPRFVPIAPCARGTRSGLTLIEVAVTLVIVAVIATVIGLNVNASSRGGEAERLDQAALELSKIADAAARYSGVQGTNSFSEVMLAGGTNPGKLSHLTTKLLTGDLNSCGGAYISLANWKGPFYPRILPTAGVQVAAGFFADDTLSRYDSTGVVRKVPPSSTNQNTTSWGTLAIVMQGVTRSDAEGLRSRVEGTSTVTTGVVRFATTGDPVTLYYHFNIHGC